MSDFCLVLWTAKDEKEAKKIATALLEKKLVACATLLTNAESLFVWEGKIEIAKEVQVIFKTQKKCFVKLKESILHEASYEVPEILQIPIQEGLEQYLAWIQKTTS